MSTDSAMDTADEPNGQTRLSDNPNHPQGSDYERTEFRLLNSSPEPSASGGCSRISDLDGDDLSSYEQYEAGMPSGCTFRSPDELPVFRIQSLSPTSRSLSPIEFNGDDDDGLLTFSLSPCGSSSDIDESPSGSSSRFPEYDSDGDSDRISIASINALIGTPPASGPPGKRLNLETIFEGVFLHTPPQKSARIKEYVEDQRNHVSRQRRLELPELDAYCDEVSSVDASEPSDAMLLLSIRN